MAFCLVLSQSCGSAFLHWPYFQSLSWLWHTRLPATSGCYSACSKPRPVVLWMAGSIVHAVESLVSQRLGRFQVPSLPSFMQTTLLRAREGLLPRGKWEGSRRRMGSDCLAGTAHAPPGLWLCRIAALSGFVHMWRHFCGCNHSICMFKIHFSLETVGNILLSHCVVSMAIFNGSVLFHH